jgi:hypothetical protein
MTHEQNIIACALQLAHENSGYLECMAEFDDDESACNEWNDARETAIERLCQALVAAGIDVRDPEVWNRVRSGQWVIV